MLQQRCFAGPTDCCPGFHACGNEIGLADFRVLNFGSCHAAADLCFFRMLLGRRLLAGDVRKHAFDQIVEDCLG